MARNEDRPRQRRSGRDGERAAKSAEDAVLDIVVSNRQAPEYRQRLGARRRGRKLSTETLRTVLTTVSMAFGTSRANALRETNTAWSGVIEIEVFDKNGGAFRRHGHKW